MVIEIRKAGFSNKGAALMLHAAVKRIRSIFPDAVITMRPTSEKSSYSDRAKLGLWQRAHLVVRGINLSPLFSFIPYSIRKMYGIVLEKEVDIILDAAGFSYSDQLGIGSIIEAMRIYRIQKKKGKVIILLPQAYGPFNTLKSRRSMKYLLETVDLVFARDNISYNFLSELGFNNIKIAPDFTISIPGDYPCKDFYKDKNFCVIPNRRIISNTKPKDADLYRSLLSSCCHELIKYGVKPFFLIHGGKADSLIANEVNSLLGISLPVVEEYDALKIKGIIGGCLGMIGSRFHGIASALYQSVPVIAIGWSHKYNAVLEEYGVSDLLLDYSCNMQDIQMKIDHILNEPTRGDVINKLKNHNEIIKNSTELMWGEVENLIRSKVKLH